MSIIKINIDGYISMDDVRNGLKAGVYIVNGKKMIIK